MRRRVVSIGSTEIYIHPAALLTAAYMIVTGFGGWFTVALISIVLHEAAHAIVSTLFGKPPQEIELTPLGALMRLEDDWALPPFKRLLTVLAGPGMTFLLGWAALMGVRHGYLDYFVGKAVFMSNLSILLMNLLPALPLDGGRLLAQGLSLFVPPQLTGRIMRLLGILVGATCVALNLWMTWRLGGWNLSLTAAGCFLMYSAAVSTTSHSLAQLRSFVDRKIRLEGRGVQRTLSLAINDRMTAQKAAVRLHPGKYTSFIVVETGTQRVLKVIHERELIAACLSSPGMTMGALAMKSDA